MIDQLADLKDVLGDRPAVMVRELTKLHEELVHGPLSRISDEIKSRELKGEVVIVVGPPLDIAVTDDEILARLQVALESMRLKDAANAVADALGVAKSRVYNLGLKAKGQSS